MSDHASVREVNGLYELTSEPQGPYTNEDLAPTTLAGR